MRDAVWIATLLRAGLLKGSFVPERDIRDLRQFTRYRRALVRDITSQKNRIEKLLQSSGFSLSSFLSDIFGSSGLAIMDQVVQVGHICEQSLAICLRGRARIKLQKSYLASMVRYLCLNASFSRWNWHTCRI
jgi:transposase